MKPQGDALAARLGGADGTPRACIAKTGTPVCAQVRVLLVPKVGFEPTPPMYRETVSELVAARAVPYHPVPPCSPGDDPSCRSVPFRDVAFEAKLRPDNNGLDELGPF